MKFVASGVIAATIVTTMALDTASAQVKAPTAAPTATSAASNDGQSIKIGALTVPRPFGSELVDRLRLAGSYRLNGRRVHLVRGEAAGACQVRYVFVTEQRGTTVASAPFGTCSGDARVSQGRSELTVAMSGPAIAGAPGVARFAFDGSVVRPLTESALAQATPICLPAARVAASEQVSTIATFEDGFPRAFRVSRELRRIDIDPVEMRGLMTALACLAPWPAAERRIPDLATPLFTSRHAPDAFATLSAIAVDPTSTPHLRASARSFAAEMTYRIGRREPL